MSQHPKNYDNLKTKIDTVSILGKKVLVVRDDILPVGGGGSKARKLPGLLDEYERNNYKSLIFVGNRQSNSVRIGCIAAIELGIPTLAILDGYPQDSKTGNEKLIHLTAGGIVYTCSGSREVEISKAKLYMDNPFVVPYGGSHWSAVRSFADSLSFLQDIIHPTKYHYTRIYCPTGSGGLHAGLILGMHKLFPGENWNVVGVGVDATNGSLAVTSRRLFSEAVSPQYTDDIDGQKNQEFIQGHPIDTLRKINVIYDFVGDGYGIGDIESRKTQAFIAKTTGLILDQVYTAKAMRSVLHDIQNQNYKDSDEIMFWHSGGMPIALSEI